MDERALTERLITYDTSNVDGLRAAAGFIKGWLEAREIDVHDSTFGELPVLTASVGPAAGPTLVFHGHLDVVPGLAEQFSPRVEGDRLYGRGAYDMKGGLAAMMCALRDLADQDAVRVRILCAPDEESEDIDTRSIDEVEMVSTKTRVGSIGLLANHQPMLAMLDPTELRLYKSESEVVRFAQGEGFLQMTGEHALVLVDEVFPVDQLNASELRDRAQRAEDELANAEEGSEEARVAARDKRRYDAFLKLAEGN